MKKIINDPNNIIEEFGEGFELAHSNLIHYNREYNFIIRKDLKSEKVKIISGGGSGHEPSHAGFVGEGMLDAAVCGNIFTSPSISQIYNAILATKPERGVLLIIKNYTGDVMNFDMAVDMIQDEKTIEIEKVYINDDVAVKNSSYTVGRRGVAGTVFVHKIAGALAEKGANLREVKEIAERVVHNVRTIGFAFTSCTSPLKEGKPIFDIGEDEMEFGVGIHGEPGVSRDKIVSAKKIAQKMLEKIIPDLPFNSKDEICLLINGLGGTPLQELYILNREIRKLLSKKGIRVYDTFIGNFMTSLDMAGASVSLLKVDDKMKSFVNAQANTPAFKI